MQENSNPFFCTKPMNKTNIQSITAEPGHKWAAQFFSMTLTRAITIYTLMFFHPHVSMMFTRLQEEPSSYFSVSCLCPFFSLSSLTNSLGPDHQDRSAAIRFATVFILPLPVSTNISNSCLCCCFSPPGVSQWTKVRVPGRARQDKVPWLASVIRYFQYPPRSTFIVSRWTLWINCRLQLVPCTNMKNSSSSSNALIFFIMDS